MKRIITTISLTLVLAFAICVMSAPSVEAYTKNVAFGNTGRNTYIHNDRYKNYLMVDGVDASYYQSTDSNWVNAKASGVDFVILRVTWSGYGKFSDGLHYKNVDSNFKKNYDKAKAAGIMTGAYVFSQAKTITEAKNEAKFAIKTIEEKYGLSPASFNLPIYMDYEFSGGKSGRLYGLSDSTATKCAKAFCDTIRAAGYQPGIYANTSFFTKLDISSIGSDVDLWCAQYYKKCESTKVYSKWQFSSSAKIRSIYSTGTNFSSVDVNTWYIKKSPSATNSKNIASCTVYGRINQNYTGEKIEPSFQVYNKSGKLLTKNKDYTVGYINNIRRGELQAYAYISGVNNSSDTGYTGYVLIPFTIGDGYIANMGLGSCKTSGGDYIIEDSDFASLSSIEEPLEESTENNASELSKADSPLEENASEAGVISSETEPALSEEEANMKLDEAETETQDDSGEKASSDAASNSENVIEGERDGSTAADEATADTEEAGLSEAEEATLQSTEIIITKYYIKKVPDGMAAGELLDRIAIRKSEKGKGYSLKVIDATGDKVSSSTKLTTGMLLAIYQTVNKETSLVGTSLITLDGKYITSNSGNSPSRNLITLKLSYRTLYYNGNTRKPTSTVTWNDTTVISGKTSSNSYVKLSYPSTSWKPGTYTVNATGVTYPGTASAQYKIAIKPTSIESLTAASKSFKFKAKQQPSANVSGYQLKYSKSSSMSSSTTVTVGTKYTSTSCTVSGLSSGTTYYVKTRCYKTIQGKKYYSSWSSAKSVKVK